MEIGAGDEVICPAFTFYATPRRSPASAQHPSSPTSIRVTLNLDPRGRRGEDHAADEGDHAGASLRPAGAARQLAALGLPLIEDAAQAFGSPGIATTGVCSTFSFFPTKNLFALGDGGLVACSDDEVAERLRMLRFHGSLDKRHHELVGTNSRLDAIQAAALRVFLPHLAGWNASRREAAARYAELGLGEAVELPRRRARATSITSSSPRSPDRERDRGAPDGRRDRLRRVLLDAALTSSLRCATSATARVASRDGTRCAPRTSRCPCGAGSAEDAGTLVVETVLAAAGVAA